MVEGIKVRGKGWELGRTNPPGAVRGPEAGEGGGYGEVSGAHGAHTRPERPDGRRPRSHSVSTHGGPQPVPPSPRSLRSSHPGRSALRRPHRARTASAPVPPSNCPGSTCPADRTETPTPPPDVTSGRARRRRNTSEAQGFLAPAPGGGATQKMTNGM